MWDLKNQGSGKRPKNQGGGRKGKEIREVGKKKAKKIRDVGSLDPLYPPHQIERPQSDVLYIKPTDSIQIMIVEVHAKLFRTHLLSFLNLQSIFYILVSYNSITHITKVLESTDQTFTPAHAHLNNTIHITTPINYNVIIYNIKKHTPSSNFS